MRMVTIQDLPKELLSVILSKLTTPAPSLATSYPMGEVEEWVKEEVAGQRFGALATAALVCRKWRVAAEHPSLWKRFVLQATPARDVAHLPVRFAKVTRIVMKSVEGEQAEALWRQVVERMEQGRLDTLVCVWSDFTGIMDQTAFCRGVAKLRHFEPEFGSRSWNPHEGSLQVELFIELAAAIRAGSCRLVRLGLDGTLLVSVPPTYLATAISRLVKLDICGLDNLTSRQVVTVMEAVANSNTLMELRIEANPMEEVKASLMAKAVHRLTKVSLDIPRVDQLVQVLQGCLDKTNLRDLAIVNEDNPMKEVAASLMAKAVHRLTRVALHISRVDQLEEVFQGCLDKTNLRNLSIFNTDGALQEVDRKLMDEAKKKVNIYLEEEDLDSEEESFSSGEDDLA